MAYFTKRRFGVLGLALCAGWLLSTSWAVTLTPMLEAQGLQMVAPPLTAVVRAVLIIAPAIILLFSGPTYAGMVGRVGGAAAFALFAFVLLLDPLGDSLVFENPSLQIYNIATTFSSIIIVGSIIVALVDTLLTRTPKRRKSSSEH